MRSSNSFHNGLCAPVIRWLRACVIGALLIHASYAIDPNRAMSQYVRDRWGTDQGFPRGPVYAIAQTPDGYLWIGTEAGLVRFDGWNFRLMRDESGAFTITSVLGLTTGPDGSLWIRLEDLTILRYHNGVFENPTSGPVPPIDISAMSRAQHQGILAWRMDNGALDFGAAALPSLPSAKDLPRSPVTAIAQTSDGDIWMGTRDAGLFRFGGGKTTPIRNGLPDLKINCLLAGENQDLWVGTDNGIVKWNGQELTGAGLPPSLNRFQALAIVRDRDGNTWVGTDSRGLLRFNSLGVASLEESDSKAVTALFEDREGNLWIGSANGLERLRDSAFITYSRPEGLPADGSNPLFVDAHNRLWFAPVDGGLVWMKDGKHGSVHAAGMDKDVVYSISGRNGELVARQAAWRINRSSRRARFFQRHFVYACRGPRSGQRLLGLSSPGWNRVGGYAQRRREQARQRQIHNLHHRERAGLKHRRFDTPNLRWHHVVCDTNRLERSCERPLANLCRPRRLAFRRRELPDGRFVGPALDRNRERRCLPGPRPLSFSRECARRLARASTGSGRR